MPSPFPGMDPWLEHPALWPDVHQSLITYSRDALQAQVGANYVVSIGERVYLEGPDRVIYPDVAVVEARQPRRTSGATAVSADPCMVVLLESVEVRQPFLEIRDMRAGKHVVTVIEILSPTNKRLHGGRELYVQKQQEVLASDANLVEVDLLRGGEPTVAIPPSSTPKSTYRVIVSRSRDRSKREVYPIGLRDRLPRVAIPLAGSDPDVVLDLPAVFAEAYEKGAYARRVDYREVPTPPLAGDEHAFAQERVRTGS